MCGPPAGVAVGQSRAGRSRAERRVDGWPVSHLAAAGEMRGWADHLGSGGVTPSGSGELLGLGPG